MNAMQQFAIFGVYALATVAALAGIVWLVANSLDRLATPTGFARLVIQYARDRHGREAARTAVEQREEIARLRRSDLARHDYLQGRLNAALIMFGRLMPEGYDASILGGLDMLESDVRARLVELGLDPDARRPMVNFHEEDYRLIAYAFGDYDEKYDKAGNALPMAEIPRFRDMRYDDEGTLRPAGRR